MINFNSCLFELVYLTTFLLQNLLHVDGKLFEISTLNFKLQIFFLHNKIFYTLLNHNHVNLFLIDL